MLGVARTVRFFIFAVIEDRLCKLLVTGSTELVQPALRLGKAALVPVNEKDMRDIGSEGGCRRHSLAIPPSALVAKWKMGRFGTLLVENSE